MLAIDSHDRCFDPMCIHVAAVGDVTSGPQTIVDREPSVCVSFLYCVYGRVEVDLSSAEPVFIGEGDILVVFPGRIVTVKVVSANNRLMFVTLRGIGVVTSAMRMGFWDMMRFNELHSGEYMQNLVDAFVEKGGASADVILMAEHLLSNVWYRERNRDGLSEFYDVIQTIGRLPAESFSTLACCKTLGMSRTKMNDLFRAAGHGSPGRHMDCVKLWRIKELLVDTALTVDDIAQRTGFSGASAMTYFFRRTTGRTPAMFRKKPIWP